MIATDVRKIERVPLKHVDDVEAQLRGSVLRKANELFGYGAESFGAAGELAKALVELDVAPLKQEQVAQYMKSKTRAWVVNRRAAARWAFNLGWPMFVVGSILLAKWEFGLHETATTMSALDFLMLAGIVSSIFLIPFVNVVCISNLENRKYSQGWERYVLGKTGVQTGVKRGKQGAVLRWVEPYQGYVPVHVLNLAVSIKERVPEATFFVDELQQTYENVPRPLPDPFLSVSLGGENYYVAVWDEREFEAKM